MTTNSRNSRMKYRGFNNGRIYRAQLDIKKEKREIERKLVNGLSYIGCTLGLLITNAILYFARNNFNAKMEQQAAEQKVVHETQSVQERAVYNKRKQQRRDKRNELIDQWFKHMGKFVNGKYVTVSLEDYSKMTDKKRREWDEK
nr:MAG TPA: hypothetical protein [Bacteriophage sp.]